MQDTSKIFILVANVQALTDYYDQPDLIKRNIYQVIEDYLAVGLDPKKCTIFVQSEIKALFEMTIYFLNLVTLARAQQNPTVKDEIKMRGFKKSISCGFLCYPISQAADILAFSPDYVPVGKDQLPMIEQTNEIADKFNSIYNSSVLKRCEAVVGFDGSLVGIDGKQKASKSLKNAIFLNDSDEIMKAKVDSMYTDPLHIKISDSGNVENNVVFKYLDAFYSNKEHLMELKEHYKRGGLGDTVIKSVLFEALREFLGPIRERRSKVTTQLIKECLAYGNCAASSVADETLHKMRFVLGLD